jgi:hypothetical protein
VNVDRAGHYFEAGIDQFLAVAQGFSVEAGGPQEGALEQTKGIVLGAREVQDARHALGVVGQRASEGRIARRPQVALPAGSVETHQTILANRHAHRREVPGQSLCPAGGTPGDQSHHQPGGLQLLEQLQGARGQLAPRSDGVVDIRSQHAQSGERRPGHGRKGLQLGGFLVWRHGPMVSDGRQCARAGDARPYSSKP